MTETTGMLPMTIAEKRSLVWLLHASDCGDIISGAVPGDVANLQSILKRLLAGSVRRDG